MKTLLLLAAALVPGLLSAEPVPAESEPRYRIGVCDWMILKRQKLNAFPLAAEIGVDGVELDMGSLGDRETFDSQLDDPAQVAAFLAAAREHGLEIPTIAMSGFYAQSFAERPTVPRMVADCLATMRRMGVGVAFLPLGVTSDPALHPEQRPAVVARLREVGRMAAEAGVVIGIESALPADEQLRLLDEVGSPAIKLYYNFLHPLQAGRDLIGELRTLGAERIVAIHCTNGDRSWLQNDPQLDFPGIKRTLDEIGWRGWLVIERGRDPADVHNVKRNYGANAAFLKSIFQAGEGGDRE